MIRSVVLISLLVAPTMGITLKNTKNAASKFGGVPKVHLVVFGNGMYSGAVGRLADEAKQSGIVDEVYSYTDFPEFITSDKRWEPHLQGGTGAGYWFWKAPLMKHALEAADEGDVVLYIDSGCEVGDPKQFEQVAKDLCEHDMAAYSLYHQEKKYTKGDVFDFFGTTPQDPTYGESPQILATYFAVKNTKATREFVQKWEDLSANFHLISDEGSNTPNDGEFVDHRRDQSLFSLLLKSNELTCRGDVCDQHPNLKRKHEKFGIPNFKGLIQSDIGYPPEYGRSFFLAARNPTGERHAQGVEPLSAEEVAAVKGQVKACHSLFGKFKSLLPTTGNAGLAPTAKKNSVAGLDPRHVSQNQTQPKSASAILSEYSKLAGLVPKTKAKTFFAKPADKVVLIAGPYIELEGQLESCSATCDFTTDVGRMDQADAVVLNAAWRDEWDLGGKRDGQKWVYNFFYEAPNRWAHMSRERTDRVNGQIDWTMTYQGKSDFHAPYFKFVEKGMWDKRPEKKDYAKGREHVALAFVSNCENGGRLDFLHRLNDLTEGSVHIFGACGEPDPCGGGNSGNAWAEDNECYTDLFSKYKFYGAFENERCDGYVTEKALRPFLRDMVPLFVGGMGPDDYHKMGIPKKAFIHTDQHNSTESLAKFMKEMSDEEYNQHFEWKQHFDIKIGNEVAMCELCQELHKEEQKPSRSFGDSLGSWFFDGTCRDY